jgi:hypothetical protein
MENITKCIPINYYTYNSHVYFLAISITIVYVIFFSTLYLAFSYETSNKADICNPTFYYGDACKRQIARTALTNQYFLPVKQKYYNNVETSINPRIQTDQSKTDAADISMNAYLTANEEFNETTIQEIQDITDVLNLISTKYLGSIKKFLASSTNKLSAPVQQALNDIPGMILSIQDKLNKSIIEPAASPFISPLQKLYKALTNINSSNV